MKHESTVSNLTRRDFAFIGPIWRNNVGACTAVDDYGKTRHIRYGLANESAKQNEKIKSSDLIGITPIIIRPEHVGMMFGVFTAFETKKPNWSWRPGDTRAQAQAHFHEIVRNVGGFAGFVSDPAHIHGIIKR